MPTMINCPYCGKLTDPQLDSCVHCGGFLKKQSGPRPARRSAMTSQTCPKCGALVKEGDIICVACGVNLLTGQKVAEQQGMAPIKIAAAPVNRLPYIIGSILVLLVLLIGALIVYWLTRDPVAKAKRLANNGRMSEAVALLEDHVAENTDDATAHHELGRMYWLGSDMTRAAQNFEKAARLDPGNDEAARMAVISYGQVETPSGRDAQLALLERVTQEDPNDAEMLYLLGLARGLKSDYSGQVDALSRSSAVEANPAARRAEAAGRALQNDLRGAQEQLAAANPSEADTLAAGGIISAMEGDSAAATAKLQDAVNADTSIQDEALTRLGLLLIEQGNYGEAYSRLDEALKLNPNNATAKYFHAVCLDRQRLTSQALMAFETLAGENNPFQAKAAVQAARLNLAQQNADRALQTLSRVPVPNAPTDLAELETVRGRANMMLGDIDGARDSFRKATQADPNYAPAHLEMGLVLVQRQDIQEGIRELERYLNLVDREDPESGTSEVQALIDQLRSSVDSGRTAERAEAPVAGERGVS